MSETFDIAILGGGCAGLSLARELTNLSYSKRVIIIEPRTIYEHDRTWCFWAKARHSLSTIVSKKWQNWQFSIQNHIVKHTGRNLSYQQIRSTDFYQSCLETIAIRSNIELRQGLSAKTISINGDWVSIETDKGPIAADFVIDTRPRPPHEDTAMLWQIFSGAEVETKASCFDPLTAGLMENMKSDPTGLKFTYVLPTTTHRALIQTTRFALTKIPPGQLDDEFHADLNAHVEGPVTLKRWERGCLPMGQTVIRANTSSRIIRAGQAAGVLRASSGYGFLRIQAWAQALANDLVEGETPCAKPFGSPLERKMDSIFLAALLRSPHSAAGWFIGLADYLTGDEFGQFMSQSPSLSSWLKVVSALPKIEFVHALFGGITQIHKKYYQATK